MGGFIVSAEDKGPRDMIKDALIRVVVQGENMETFRVLSLSGRNDEEIVAKAESRVARWNAGLERTEFSLVQLGESGSLDRWIRTRVVDGLFYEG